MSKPIKLPQNLTIHQIDVQFSELNEKISAASDTVTFDASEVETIDTAGLQALLIMTQSAIANDKTVSWEKVPEILSTSAAKIGIDSALQF